MKNDVWKEVRGFSSLSEFSQFVRYIEEQVSSGIAEEIPADANYGRGEIFGGRWFKNNDSGEVWRLVEPDFPFTGLWERVA
jgi:hypothetical protein